MTGVLIALPSTAIAAPIPVISYLLDGDTTPQHGSVTGSLLGPGGTNNLPQYSTDTPLAYTGNKSLDFDGTDDRVSIGNKTVGQAAHGQSAITLTSWIKYDSLSSGKYENAILISTVGSGTSSGLWANIRGDGADAGKLLIGGRSEVGDGFSEAYSATALSSDTWHFVVGILDFANDKIWISTDGGTLASTTVTFSSSTYNDTAVSATDDDVISKIGRYWDGKIDEVAIFNGSLSQSDITLLHEQGLNAIPEPGAIGLLGMGMACIFRLRRRI